jgi:GNAT superfamily N-acetyltransferase
VDDVASRILAFERALQERMSTRVEPFRWGRVFLDDRFPKRWDSNFLWVEGSLDGVRARDLAAEADRVLGGAGLAHREVLVDDDGEGRRLAPGMIALGYEADHLVTMTMIREPDRWNDHLADEVDFVTIRPSLEEVGRRQPRGKDDPDAVRMLADYRGELAETLGCRFFATRVDGRIASTCELYMLDGVAQVEDVNAFDEHRGRGLGRAVVLRAVRAAREAGCDLVFLSADDADWPKHLYGKLGFEPFDRSWSFVKPATPGPPAHRDPSAPGAPSAPSARGNPSGAEPRR